MHTVSCLSMQQAVRSDLQNCKHGGLIRAVSEVHEDVGVADEWCHITVLQLDMEQIVGKGSQFGENIQTLKQEIKRIP